MQFVLPTHLKLKLPSQHAKCSSVPATFSVWECTAFPNGHLILATFPIKKILPHNKQDCFPVTFDFPPPLLICHLFKF